MVRDASERQAKRAQNEHETMLQERAEHIARLRSLRLAKEAGEKAAGTRAGASRGRSGSGES